MVTGLVASKALIALVLALMTPLLTMAPLSKVLQLQISMPVCAPVMVPEFETLPKKEPVSTTMPAPDAPTLIVPELVMPPLKVNIVVVLMPTADWPPVIVPLLLMPPEKFEMKPATMPPVACAPTLIVPLLVMPPPRLSPNCATPFTKMPICTAEIVPELVMPPENNEVTMPKLPSTTIPRGPDTRPLLVMPPLKVETR